MKFSAVLFILAYVLSSCSELQTPTPTVENDIEQVMTSTLEIVASPMPTSSPTEVASQTVTVTEVPFQPTPSGTATEVLPTMTPTVSPVTTIGLRQVASGLNSPTFLESAGDGRLFVVEQPGRLVIVEDGSVLSRPFLDITDRVGSTASEQGLLSLAFDPLYAENGYFYVDYTDLNGNTVVSRFSVFPDDPDLADADSEIILLQVNQPYGNHNGGQLQFGPDGYLYIGMGDGGSAGDPQNNGQNPSTLLGSILRVDVTDETGYQIPTTNPFVSSDRARPEIWAFGLRNPWRFSFDSLTGDLYIADVGQNLWEEVNIQKANSAGGENYGWNILEASHCFLTDPCDSTGMVLPIAEYQHLDGNCSITGGYVYRGEQFPGFWGNYFYADYCSGRIWTLFQKDDGSWAQTQVLDSSYFISSFGEDASGELYFTDLASGGIFQITEP